MKKIIVIFLLILAFGLSAIAQNNTTKNANDLYSKGEYKIAASAYEKIIANQGVSPELYYNLGNAYYKSGEVGKSILNYERALRLRPTYDDAKTNLEMAQLKVVDNVVQIPPFFVMRWIDGLMKLLTSNQWLVLSLFFWTLTLTSILFFIFGKTLTYRKASFYVAIVFIGLSVFSGLFSGIRKYQMVNHNEAIILSGAVNIKSSPDKSGTDLFLLHEGTKVKIKSTLDKWVEVVIGNGNVGWIESNCIERI